MKRFILVIMSFVLCLVWGQSTKAAASVVHYQHSSALIYHPSQVRIVDDSSVHFITAPGRYTHMSASKKVNWVKSVSGHHVAFKTRLLLPYPGKGTEHWGNPQAIAMSKNNLMYIVYCPTTLRNRGRIVQYDLKRLGKLGVYKKPQILRTVYVKHHGKYSKRQRKLQKAIKIGPLFDTGHGQTLAFNPRDNGLYMWRDNRKRDNNDSQTTTRSYLQHINTQSLKPDRAISFHLRAHGKTFYGGGTQTFDQYGNTYFWCLDGSEAEIYKGRISGHSVKFRRTDQTLKRAPGTHVQSMGYNAKRGRLYLVADDSIVSFPAKQLNGRGSLTKHSFEWSRLVPRREMEGLTFDASGRAYLLANHNPEVLRSTSVY